MKENTCHLLANNPSLLCFSIFTDLCRRVPTLWIVFSVADLSRRSNLPIPPVDSEFYVFSLRPCRRRCLVSPSSFVIVESLMDPQTQNTSLQRLQNVERRVVRVLDIAGGVMEELASPSGPKKEFINSHCREFMQSMKDIQVTLREEIKSACEYRPFEKCDYNARIANELCFQKLEYVLSQLDDLKKTVDRYPSSD